MLSFFSICANTSLHQAALEEQRKTALQRLLIYILNAAARRPHSYLIACQRRLPCYLPVCSPILAKFSTVLTMPEGDLHVKKSKVKSI